MPRSAMDTIRKDKLKNIILNVAIALGVVLAVYPFLSQWVNRRIAQDVNQNFDEAVQAIAQPEVDRRLDLARAYNETLDPRLMADPFDERQKEGKAEYARMLEVKEQIGYIRIPAILTEVPIYAGTSELVLQKGAGHLEGTSLPVGGNHTHTVITAHRGLPSKQLFTDLPKLEVGDKFYLHNLGEVLCYQVDQILTVEPNDFSKVLVVPGHDYATLLTCTPYMLNTHRLLVRGVRIDYVAAIEEKNIADRQVTQRYKILFIITLVALIAVLIKRSRKRRE